MKVRRLFRWNSVYKRLVVQFLACSIIPLILLTGISYSHSWKKAGDTVIEAITATNEQIAINIANRIAQIESMSESITYHMYQLSRIPTTPITAYLETYAASRTGIESISSANSVLETVIFLPEEKLLSDRGNHIDILPLGMLEGYNCTEQELLEKEKISFWKFTGDQRFASAITSKSYDVLTYWNVSRDLTAHQLNYAYAVYISTQGFSDLMREASYFGGSNYMLDKEGHIVACSDHRNVGNMVEPNIFEVDEGVFTSGKDRYVVQRIQNTEFLLCTQIPESFILQSSSFTAAYILLAAALISLLAVVSSVAVSKSFTGRIARLSVTIESTQASSDRSALDNLSDMRGKPDSDKDEIDRLADTYQAMLLQNDHVQKCMIEMVKQEEKLKYQLLQAQINPHFLFNTLAAIESCIGRGEEIIAGKMLGKLADFYRLLLRTYEDEISIDQELHITQLYLQMVRFCKKTQLSWEVDLEDGIGNFKICKFVLQPIVENAVMHGVVHEDQPLHIRIQARYTEDGIFFAVEDNGVGIPAKMLAELRSSMERPEIDLRGHYGIANVDRRLRRYSCTQDGIRIDSVLGKGTVCSFCIRQVFDQFPEGGDR